jgi:hypothetical protein
VQLPAPACTCTLRLCYMLSTKGHALRHAQGLLCIEVEATITRPESVEISTSNTFSFIYQVGSAACQWCRVQILIGNLMDST